MPVEGVPRDWEGVTSSSSVTFVEEISFREIYLILLEGGIGGKYMDLLPHL